MVKKPEEKPVDTCENFQTVCHAVHDFAISVDRSFVLLMVSKAKGPQNTTRFSTDLPVDDLIAELQSILNLAKQMRDGQAQKHSLH